MATRYIHKEYGANSTTAIADDATGRRKVQDLPNAVGFVYDLVDNNIKYNAEGAIRVLAQLSGQTPVQVTAATVTLGPTHVGRTTVLDRAAGIAVTLPASSGSGNTYFLHVQTTFTGASTVKVANATDVMQGTAILFADAGDTVVGFATTATSDTIDLLGTSNSTGGIFGATIELVDHKSGFWSVRYVSDAGGTEATPFSATV